MSEFGRYMCQSKDSENGRSIIH